MARSLKDYYDIYLWINVLVYMLYVFIKYAVVIYLSTIPCQRACSERKDSVKKKKEEPRREDNDTCEASKGENSKESTSDTNTLVDDIESKGAHKKTTCCQQFQPMKWIQWSVKLVFRNQLDLEDKLKKQKSSTNQKSLQELHERGNGQSNGEDGPKIELNHQSTVILFTLIATFGLLAIGSALNVTLLSVTHACTEAPNINCYPQLINEVEVQNAGLNISIAKPIEDCSFWNSEGVSDKVSIICYQLVFNIEIFLAIIGGLSTVFVATMRTVIRVLLWCTRKCGKTKEKCGRCLPAARYALALILSGIELSMAVLGMVLQGTGTSVNDTPGVMFLATHAAEILLVIGIIPTLLLLPWEDYKEKMDAKKDGEEYEMSEVYKEKGNVEKADKVCKTITTVIILL